MGCLNGTCGVTNLPIYEDARVVLIPLRGNIPLDVMAGKGFTDNNVLAEPTGLHIRGTYNGYYFEPDDKSVALEAFVSLMAAYVENGNRLMRIKEGRKTTFAPVKRAMKGPQLLAALQDGSLAFNMQSEVVGFGSMLVLESTFDRLAHEAGRRVLKGFTASTGEFMKLRHKACNQLKLHLDVGRSFDKKALQEIDESLTDTMKELGFTRAHFQFGQAYALMVRRAPFASKLLEQAVEDDAVLQVITDFLLFQDAFDGLRKHWQIQCGLSQVGLDEFGSFYKIVADSIHESLAARK
jgi:hypothetical protein